MNKTTRRKTEWWEKGRRLLGSPFNWRLLLAALLVASICGILTGYFFSTYKNVARITALENYQPNIITTIYAASGEILDEFAIEKRVTIRYQDIPPRLIEAFIAVEDRRFYRHIGLDPLRIVRATLANLTAGRIVQGASTITQQLTRSLFLTPEVSYKRKIREALYAIQVENHYTKEKILELYFNQILLGHNRYGVEAASQFYFSKSARELTLEECALLASIPKSPSTYSPIKHPERALRRRNLVLDLMVREGFISREEAEEAKRKPIALRQERRHRSLAPYFVEEVRKYLERHYGRKETYQSGLKVYTTLDLRMQKVAQHTLRKGLRELDKREGFRGIEENILEEGTSSLEAFQHPDWDKRLQVGDIVTGLIVQVTRQRAVAKFGEYEAKVGNYETRWTGKKPSQIFKVGDLARFQILDINDEKKELKVSLEQEPMVDGALVSIEVGTGAIKAMAGGYDFNRSKFNRAVQAKRQTGSSFKPFVYTAALDNGLTASTTIFDEPTTFYDHYTDLPYEPENYYREYYGVTTLRGALEKSLNVSTVKLQQTIGVDEVIKYAKSMGMKSVLYPYLSLALGACEATLMEMTATFSVFPNQGVLVEPFFISKITDREGEVIYEHQPTAREALSQETSFLMVNLLQGVTERGTAAAAKSLERPLAGKTGTTDKHTDAWFIGFTPSLACGVWVGFDVQKSLGPGETGAKAALPIWMGFFEEVLKDKPIEYFLIPSNIVFRRIDRRTGLLATPFCPPEEVVLEAFLQGSEPVNFCSEELHRNLRLPYHLQQKWTDIQ